ncbi:phosphotransferase-like protein [Streptomyces pimonensis]|uniref:phosphotransferase-like protein n=1 Tax=Streptomyces pimonensis TaxID=2860288 RepID=UPI003528FAF3
MRLPRVHCPLDEACPLRAGPGRPLPGLAAHRYDLVHGHGDYDLECDTSAASPRECAQRIKEFLPHRPSPTAFARLRRRHLTGAREPLTA